MRWKPEKATVNGYNVKVMFDRNDRGLIFSVNEALRLLQTGAIEKSDFIGDPNVILAEGTIKDKAVFKIKEMRIGQRTATGLEATVSAKITEGVIMGESTIGMFGRFKLDENNKQIIFN